jgi:large subunit ribosomal protein L6
MSRVGNMPIEVPQGVKVDLDQRNTVTVIGPNGELSTRLHRDMIIEVDAQEIRVKRPSDGREHRSLHGLTRSLIANMVTGVTDGFEKRLEIRGVGYRAEQQGANILFRLGFSHDITYDAPEGVALSVENNLIIVVRSADKRAVGHVAAEIRSLRPVEAYKGKGIRYVGERIRLKPGKAAKIGADLGG